MRLIQTICIAGSLFLFLTPPICNSQIVSNGDFDSSTNGWFARGPTNIEITTNNHASGSACLVTGCFENWHGVKQSLVGDLVEGTDYHFVAYVKTKDVPKGRLRFEITQTDDRGARYLSVGEIEAVDDQWTMLQAGFTFESIGTVTDLDFQIVGGSQSASYFDFIVDSVVITENDWLVEANMRIDEIRKRDVELSFRKPNGGFARNHEVLVQQIRHHFPFGSTLNPAVVDDPVYREFFRKHFEFATIEWDSQWKAIEGTQNVEDYTIADASFEFAEANAIPIKGHALVWPDPLFRPAWLDSLSPAQLNTELNERITSAVTRYKSKFYGWDVGNEWLNFSFFQDQLGNSIRSWMFLKAKEIAPNAKLFTNEYGISRSQLKSKNYHDMVDSFLTAGAEIGGIGMQSHFEGTASVKGIEIALGELTDFGIEIWFSEYDTVNPDAEHRADSLESFYRYAFSRPEIGGIVMWGFWAGAHWQGADAALVDLDWTINAAGQRYFDLMNEWSTNFAGNTQTAAKLDFRGFHGDYILTTTDPATEKINYHLLRVEPGDTVLQRTLVTSYENNVLLIYGSESDDLFQYDFENPQRVYINGIAVLIPNNFGSIQFVGLGGDDEMLIKSKTTAQDFYTTPQLIATSGSPNRIRYSEIESIIFMAQNDDSKTTLIDSPDNDLLVSYPDVTVLLTPTVGISIEGFKTVRAISRNGSDLATVYDDSSIDTISYEPSGTVGPKTTIKHEFKTRWFRGFSETLVDSSSNDDVANIFLPGGDKSLEISLELSTLTVDGDIVEFSNIPKTNIYGSNDPEGTDNVNVVGSPSSERLRIAQANTLYTGSTFRKLLVGIDQISCTTQSTGHDVLLYFDTANDDQISIIQDMVTVNSAGLTHSIQFFDTIRAYGNQGGTNTATIDEPTANVTLIGQWEE